MSSKTAFSKTFSRPRAERSGPAPHWTEREVDEAAFKDPRLGRRCAEVLKQIGDAMGESIPYASQGANTNAANRFLSNARVAEGDILSGHFAATRARCDKFEGPILLLQDTTEFSFQRAKARGVHMGGGPPALTRHQREEARNALADGTATQADLRGGST
ncbi:hypothetical+protein [Methylocapsa aurea]|uniref:IS4/Tn5 family transposase DNA-binding protein n=1 Tax=Methylocapsa aurea TaxID=663610 RepID=UPI003D18F97E